MNENEVIFTEDIYSEHLFSIKDLKFTPREIDVIACLLNARRTSQIASMLSIAPRTVTTHFHNIMLKLDCNSQENIITFIERSDKLALLRVYYSRLVTELAFKKTLKEILKLKKEEIPSQLVVCWQDQNLKKALTDHLKNHLNLAGINAEISEQEFDQNVQYIEKQGHVFLLLCERKDHQEISKELFKLNYVDLSTHHNYFFSFFEIIKVLLNNVNLDKIIYGFKEVYETIPHAIDLAKLRKEPDVDELKQKDKDYVSQSAKALIYKLEEESIWTELIIPTESTLLSRPKLIEKIEESLKGQDPIQTVALIGMGGAGKTTLSRQYARKEKASIVWEFNAETKKALICSFERLGWALSKTEHEKNMITRLKEIRNITEREDKLLLLVKEKLSFCSNWILIYDNVENFSDIQKYFPHNSNVWGKGKVIITTRDSTFQNSTSVNHSISIGELASEEQLNLFVKIMNNGNVNVLTLDQKEQAQRFLQEIPPFPLDISLAAYYIKATNITYQRYLEHLSQYSKEFNEIQESVLKDANEYTKTRYSIVVLSLNHFMGIHEDFKGLLLFVSLLNSQYIPRDLLEKYKKDIIVDNFIYNLKKYSFITGESCMTSDPVFSMHRSAQQVSLVYLTKELGLEKDALLITSFSRTLESYVAYIIENFVEQDGFSKMKSLVCHYETFLSHKNLLTEDAKESVACDLGFIYFYLGYYAKAKQELENSLSKLNKNYNKNKLKIARILTYLGDIYGKLENYSQAKIFLEKGLFIHEECFPKDHVYIAWSLALLGKVYTHSHQYEKAKQLLEKSLLIYQECFPKEHVSTAWILAHLAHVYRGLKQYKTAKELLEKSLTIYEREQGKEHITTAWILQDLGQVYLLENQLETAENLLNKALSIFQQTQHSEIYIVLENLTELYLNKYMQTQSQSFKDQATGSLTQALEIVKAHFPSDSPHIKRIQENLKKLEPS